MDEVVLDAFRAAGGWLTVTHISRSTGIARGLVLVVVDKLERDERLERYHGGASNASPVFRVPAPTEEAA